MRTTADYHGHPIRPGAIVIHAVWGYHGRVVRISRRGWVYVQPLGRLDYAQVRQLGRFWVVKQA